jgi:DNA-binding IclR family transcriptional regulator
VAISSKYRAPALEKGLDILELLARSSTSLSTSEIASGVGYSVSEIFRMLQVLEEKNYIARVENDSSYSLTNRLFMLGMERPANKGLVEAALPVMHRLANETSHPCHLVVASREYMVVIARIDAPSDLGFMVRVGHRRPIAHATSGLVLFAFQSEEVRKQWLTILGEDDPRFKKKAFIERADSVRQQGYASYPSEAVEGVIDISAPIMEHGHAVGALTIPYLDRHPSRVTIKKATESLCKAVEDISRTLS